MSRRKKQPHGRNKPHPRRPTQTQRDEALVEETTRIFTCFTQIAHDFVHQCGANLEDLECDIDYNRLALEMWTGGPGRAADLVEVLTDYLALRERHHAALTALQPRLATLLATPAHDHLEPLERWRHLVHQRILSLPDAT
jgi:hypothetical protein